MSTTETKRPTGFVATCRCGAVVGAMDYARTPNQEANRLLGRWLSSGCTITPRFAGTWTATIEACRCGENVNTCEGRDMRQEVDDPRKYRLSASGFSIVTGWGGEVARYHGNVVHLDEAAYRQWLSEAQYICDTRNAALPPLNGDLRGGYWAWLMGRKFSLGEVVDICGETVTARHGDDDIRISICELLYEDYRSRDISAMCNDAVVYRK